MRLEPDDYQPEHCSYCKKDTQYIGVNEQGLCPACELNDDALEGFAQEIASMEAEMRFRANLELMMEEYN